jgi:acyl-CoA reductase-like NAD-dependent aldehyde dehydrogenase
MAPSATSNGSSGGGRLQFDTFHNVINGKLVSSEKTRHGINPATKKPNPEVPIATSQDVDDAVKAAREAFKTWSQTSVEERKKALNDYAAEFISYKDEFAKLLTREQGKPVCDDLDS